MNVLFISQNFYPERNAGATRLWENVKNFKNFDEITVLTALPNHPEGEIYDDYKGRFINIESYKWGKVIRLWVFTSKNKTSFNRLLNYLSFLLMSLIVGFLIKKKLDIIFSSSPPPFVGLTGIFLSKIKNSKFIYEVRDPYPETAIELNEIKNKILIWVLFKIKSINLNNANKIIGVGQYLCKILQEKVENRKKKVQFVPNGVNLDLYMKKPSNKLKENLSLSKKFVIGYIGLIGLASGLEIIFDVIEKLPADKFHFVFIGDGPLKEKLKKIKEEKKVKNLTFLKSLPEDRLVDYISIFDVGLVTSKEIKLYYGRLPVKMFAFMSCEIPVILSLEGEAGDLIRKSKSGIVVGFNNPKGIVDAIEYLFNNYKLRNIYGKNGRNFVEKNYSRKQLAEKLEREIIDTI